MPPVEKPMHLTLQVSPGGDPDAEELDHLTRQLLDEVQELDVESAELVKGETLPTGAKAGEVVTLGALAVTVLPVLVPKLIEFVQSWSTRAEGRIVKIKAQVDDRSVEVEYNPVTMSVDELKRLVNTITQSLPPAGQTDAPAAAASE